MNSDISNNSSLILALMAIFISLVSTILQFRKRRAFVFPLNSEQVQQTIAVPIEKAPLQVRERYPLFEEGNPDCGGGYLVLANSGDRPAFVILKRLAVTPSFIRVARYPVLAILPGEIVRHELFIHNIPALAPNDRLEITIRAEYYWIDASQGQRRSMRKHDGESTLRIDALHSYPSEEV